MLCRQLKQRKSLFEILPPSNRPNPIRITIRQEILRIRMTSIRQSLKQGSRFFHEVFSFLFIEMCGRRGGGRGVGVGLRGVRGGSGVEGFGGVDHEDGKFEDEFRVVCFFGVFSVKFEGFFIG